MEPIERAPRRPVVLSRRCISCGAPVRVRELVRRHWCSWECVYRDALALHTLPHLDELLSSAANDNREVVDEPETT